MDGETAARPKDAHPPLVVWAPGPGRVLIRFTERRIAALPGVVLARRCPGTSRYLVLDYTFRAVSGRTWIAVEEARDVVADTFRKLDFVVDPVRTAAGEDGGNKG